MELLHSVLAMVGASLGLMAAMLLLMEQIAPGYDFTWRERSAFGGVAVVSLTLTFILIS